MTFSEFLESNAVNFFWGLAAFLLFVVILLKFAFTRILAAVDAREAKIAGQMKEAEDAYTRAKKVQAEVDAKFAAAETRIAELMAEARSDAEAQKTQMVEKGRAEIEAARNRSLRDIDAARHTAVVTLRQEIAEVSIQVAEKIVKERLDAAKHEDLVGQAIDAYEARQGGKK
ncbi:MAG: F0F1 ATP synthase subunit B [Planctomycetes bacterium]|nr:F0F1 ATP synthase subunit B [Planctomycetota bacterium]